jgi:hypothetical protein
MIQSAWTGRVDLWLRVPGVARRLVTFLLRQKSNQKSEPAAPLFVFVFLSPLFSLPIGRRENSLSPLYQI